MHDDARPFCGFGRRRLLVVDTNGAVLPFAFTRTCWEARRRFGPAFDRARAVGERRAT